MSELYLGTVPERQEDMGRCSPFTRKLAQAIYDRKCLNRKIRCIHASFREVDCLINGKDKKKKNRKDKR